MEVVLKEKKKQRTKQSYEDKRPSATYVGYVAIVFLSVVIGSILLFDLHTVWVNARTRKQRKMKRKYNVLGAIVRRRMDNDSGNEAKANHSDIFEGANNNNNTKDANSANSNIAFSFERENGGSVNAELVPLPHQRQLLWKQLWPGFQKANKSQDHDKGTESEVSG